MTLLSIRDYERAANGQLSAATRDYYAGGAADELTLTANRTAFEGIDLMPRTLCGATRPDLTTRLGDQPLALPLGIAPTAFHKLAHPDGETATARAAGEAGALFVLSSLSTTAMEPVFAATDAPRHFQLYMYRDRATTRDLVARAQAAGAGAIVLTADAPVWGLREADARNRFVLPPHLRAENLAAGTDRLPDSGGSGLATYMNEIVDGGITWDDLDWLCASTTLPVWLKGVMHPDDARRAIDHGAAGLVVSNHGGRQLDRAPATIRALPAIARAVDGRVPLWLDGGIRRGADAFTALALGADGVMIGRPALWGLTVDGAAGVAAVLDILARELANTMSLCGCASLAAIHRDCLFDTRTIESR
ncbi:alpha-hydroxy acid oxidase [Salinisphaera sp. P385]|uniref:Alpha-hydroxy acid oxidase n=1 Tax=Spectribacter acetivorans TaxID=3075603 RepID=A0ABU3BCF0_9GAMM|nr:alpha-hydroxy acid oxidase [Salinisphaera sp. P385]MDT0618943.1 alpha-hydroxy acid oxidase [Salinisphaera sp. P385]